jgi:hypothetical protein
MSDAADVVAKYGQAWNEPDEAKRRELLADAWAEDGVYRDPSAIVEGRDALVAHIGGYHEAMGGHSIVQTSGVDVHGSHLRFAWKMCGPDGADVVEGVDFAELDDDGKLRSLVGFFGPWPAL